MFPKRRKVILLHRIRKKFLCRPRRRTKGDPAGQSTKQAAILTKQIHSIPMFFNFQASREPSVRVIAA